MLRENQYILRQTNIALDLLLSAAAVPLTFGLRQALNIYLFPDWRVAVWSSHLWLVPVAPLITVAALAYNGAYESHRIRSRTRQIARRIAVACAEAMLLLMAASFIFGSSFARETSRPCILLLPLVVFGLLLAKNHLLRRALMSIRRHGFNYRTVILVGSGEPLAELARTISRHQIWGLKIEGAITDLPELQGAEFGAAEVEQLEPVGNGMRIRERDFDCDLEGENGRESNLRSAIRAPQSILAAPEVPILADLADAPRVLWRTPVDEVIFCPSAATLAQLHPLMELCEEMGVRMHLPLNFYHARIAHPVIDSFDEIPVLSYQPTRDIGPALLCKYAFDRIGALALLALLSPFALGAALAIRLTSRRGEPIFFGQQRCGLNGRLFTCWKFRSMYVDAEARRASLAALNEQSGPVFKIRHDPRVTPVGRWLRKFSIDEIPQLWNVLKGDMSLVGPRPPLPAEVLQYDRWQRRRLSMRPGITCLWQVMGRNRLPFETWMKLDLQYIDNWSLRLDFKILARTVYVVLTGDGAM